MAADIQMVSFRVVAGRGAASGQREYIDLGGSIRAQKPLFQAAGLNLDSFFEGTINAELNITKFEMIQPVFCFRDVVWLPGHPGENFDFCNCTLLVNEGIYPSLIYYPRPETKKHYAALTAPNLIEILAPPIQDLEYGTHGVLYIDARQVKLTA